MSVNGTWSLPIGPFIIKQDRFPNTKKQTGFFWGASNWFGFTGDVSISICIHIFATSNCWGYHVKTFPEAWYWCSTALSSVVSWNQLRRWVSCPRRFYVNVSTCVYMYKYIYTYRYITYTRISYVYLWIYVCIYYTVYVHPYTQRLEHPFVPYVFKS